jgi:hypothetical protein
VVPEPALCSGIGLITNHGKLKFQITNQQITIQTKFSGLKIEDIPKQNMQQCAAKFAAPDFPI